MSPTTIMTAEQIYDAMKDFPFFVDNDDIIDNVKWEAIGNSDVTFDRMENQEATFVFPVKITPNHLFVGPLGKYLGNIGTIEKTKYRMMCAPPDDTLLKGVFKKAIRLFHILQEGISKTHDCRYLLESVDAERHIITSLAVFEKRVLCPTICHSISVFVPIAIVMFGNQFLLFAPMTMVMPSTSDRPLRTNLAGIVGPITSSARPSSDGVLTIGLS
ncbi:hypothetical protein JB92DRAFT_3129548 [Gautieria morchelliformis]|nr:hypothetical protein JB92DRAFT_3129548 [Gautieria morchelliformis]